MQIKQKYLGESLRHIEIADHMTFVTFPLVNEKKLLLKIFEEINKSIISLISAVLTCEKKNRKIKLDKNNQKNLKNFLKISKDYNIKKEEIKKIIEIIELNKKHKASAIEFSRKDRVIIMQDNLKIHSIDIQKIKEYLALSKSLFIKVNLILNN
jgi:hypothetical protein